MRWSQTWLSSDIIAEPGGSQASGQGRADGDPAHAGGGPRRCEARSGSPSHTPGGPEGQLRGLSELPRGEFSIDATCPQHSPDDLDPEDEEIFHDCWDGCSPYDVEYSGPSFPPGDGDSLDDPFNGLSVEHFAKKLCDEKDFSSQSCERIVKYVCAKSQNERKRQVAANTCSVALGAYTHGAFHGAIKKTFWYFHVVQ